MARTTVPTVVAGTFITAAYGNAVAAAVSGVTELQADLPEGWTNWTGPDPTVAGLTKGNGSETAAHYTVAALTFCYYRFILGTTSAVTGDLVIDTPTAMIHGAAIGGGYFQDVTDARFAIKLESIGTTAVILRPFITSGTYAKTDVACSATVPFTWDDPDTILAFWHYRNV